jgi:putative endopeptidase
MQNQTVVLKYMQGIGLACCIFILSCMEPDKQHVSAPAGPDPLFEHRFTTLLPGNDFFQYANGAWFRAHPIPASEAENGIFLTVKDTLSGILRKICEESSLTPGKVGSVTQKIGDFYASGMDTVAREKEKFKALQPEFDRISQINTSDELMIENVRLEILGCKTMFGFQVGRDQKISTKNAVYIAQGGIGLPEREYYLKTDKQTETIRQEYVRHIANMLELSGDNPLASKMIAYSVLGLEHYLALASRKMEDLRDPYANYTKMSLPEFSKLSPTIHWPELFQQMGLPAVDSVIVMQPEFVRALDKRVESGSLVVWKAYLKWKLLDTYGDDLGEALEKEDFHFNSVVMQGATEQKPRWKRMVNKTDYALQELLSQKYVAQYVPAGTKERLTTLAKNVLDVYADHIRNLDWMSTPTQEKALYKLKGVVLKIGYPDKWKDYSSLTISRNSFAGNVMQAKQWHFQYMVAKYGKPVDRNEWEMTPENYNAYYEPTNNEIGIPACNIILPGFGKQMVDDAVLYGTIGASTMGHEITHGFDDQGCLYDEKGNLHNWWTSEDSLKFNVRTKALIQQFNTYTVYDSMHVNGTNTLGENIADLGGLVMAYDAFHKTEQWKMQEKIHGFTPDQRFFLAFAYAWMQQQRKEAVALAIMSDEHAPAMWRVNGPLSNVTAFYTAFGIKPGDKMYREEKDRVKIW